MTTAAVAYPLALASIAGMMLILWAVSVIRRDASIVDPFWGLGFVLVAWVYYVTSEPGTARRWLVPILVTAWGVRLSVHLFRRKRGEGEDYRYREMRDRHPGSFAWRSLGTVFLLQGGILWIVALPLGQAIRAAEPASLTALDAIGVLLVTAGLVFEAVGDAQLARFRSDPRNRGKVLDRGLWRYTRHPNYFGDALVWWGFFALALATPRSLWTIASPILMTFLLVRVSGVALLEQKLVTTRPEYADYVRRTSAFLPRPPKSLPPA